MQTAGFKSVDVLKYKGEYAHLINHLRGMEKQHGLFKCTNMLGEKVVVSFEDKTTFLLTTPTAKHRNGALEENVLNAIGKETVLSYPEVEVESLKTFPSSLVKARAIQSKIVLDFKHSYLTQQLNITSEYNPSEKWIHLFHDSGFKKYTYLGFAEEDLSSQVASAISTWIDEGLNIQYYK